MAGLSSQDDAEEDDVPDWLAGINPVGETPSTSDEEPSDFFAQFSQTESQPSTPAADETDQDRAMEQQNSAQTDELGGWLSQQTPAESNEMFSFDQSGNESNDNSEMNVPGAFDPSNLEVPVEKEPEDLGWLHDLEATAKETGELSSPQADTGQDITSDQQESTQDDLSWLDELGGASTASIVDVSPSQAESSQDELSWMRDLGDVQPAAEEPAPAQADSSDDDLDWMKNLGDEQPATEEPAPAQADASQDDLGWMQNLGGDQLSATEEPAPAQVDSSDDDLDWMKNLGDAQSATEEPAPAQTVSSDDDLDWMKNLGDVQLAAEEPAPAQADSSQDDLGWMQNLGGDQQSATEEPTSAETVSSDDDLDWMKNLGDVQAAAEEPAPVQSNSSQDDLSWIQNLGGDQSSATEEPAPAQAESSDDDLDWMKNLDDAQPVAEEPTPAQADSSGDDLDWMKNLGGDQQSATEEPAPAQMSPPGTKPLDEALGYDSTPDWLKSAMKEPSMPAPGEVSMDWFADHETSSDLKPAPATEEPSEFQFDESDASTPGEADSVSPSLDLPVGDSSATSSQDVDAMFNIDIPDWASQESDTPVEMAKSESADDTFATDDEDLAPVDLPSWVQAMRPVDSAIGDETSSADYDANQVPETEGPLAGFSGVIPSAPIGSSLRPKAFSLKLQVTDEQQAGAVLIEQIIAGETASHPSKSTTAVASQRMLRWVLSVVFIVVLSLVIGLGSQSFDILAPGEVSELSNLIGAIPDEAPILLVVDYEPAVAGELAAAAGPVLDQLALSRHAKFTFISMSPNGSAMAEHLMMSTKLGKPAPEGMGYQAGEQYFNMGFLPGSSAGVLGFIDNPVKIMPKLLTLANVGSFSNFEAVVLLTDNADSGRVWVEQLEFEKQMHPEITYKPLIVVSSAQAGPMLEPYVSSGQVNVMINGLSDAAKYEYVNQSRPGLARSYWDSFGVGLMIAVLSIVLGAIWNIVMGIRERRAEQALG